MGAGAAATVGDGTSHDHELGEILVERPEAVVDPGSDGWELPLQHMATRVELQLGAVVVVRGPHGPHHGDVIDAVAHVWPPVADLQSAVSAPTMSHLHREDLRMDLVQSGHQLTEVLLEVGRVERGLQPSTRRKPHRTICSDARRIKLRNQNKTAPTLAPLLFVRAVVSLRSK